MRHKKFSSIGQDLTDEIMSGETYKTNRKINQIAIHCSATPNNTEYCAGDIDHWHMNRWGANSGCGYHYVIKLDGTIQKGRWVDYAGSHVKGHNNDTIGICYIGGLDKDGHIAMDELTPDQFVSLIRLVNVLTELYDLDKSDVLGHKEFPYVNKACPCLDMDQIRKNLG